MVIFDSFHVLGILQVQDQLSLNFLDNVFLVFKFFLEVLFFVLILLLVFAQLSNLHSGLQYEIFKVIGPVLEIVDLFLLFSVFTEQSFFFFFSFIQLFLLLLMNFWFVELHLGLLLNLKYLVLLQS